jgi:hypothetical protein
MIGRLRPETCAAQSLSKGAGLSGMRTELVEGRRSPCAAG